jgi:hypothetical protein
VIATKLFSSSINHSASYPFSELFFSFLSKFSDSAEAHVGQRQNWLASPRAFLPLMQQLLLFHCHRSEIFSSNKTIFAETFLRPNVRSASTEEASCVKTLAAINPGRIKTAQLELCSPAQLAGLKPL